MRSTAVLPGCPCTTPTPSAANSDSEGSRRLDESGSTSLQAQATARSDRLRLWGPDPVPLTGCSPHTNGTDLATKIPLRKGKPRHWVQVNDPDRYPYISDQDLVMLAFPSSAIQNRRVLLQRTKAVVAQLQEAGELRVVKGRIIPPERH